MIVKLLANQIPTFWDSIKYCMTIVNEVDDAIKQFYFNELLQSLLSDNSQCFVRFSETRILNSLMITKIKIDKLTGDKSINIQGLYAFKKSSDKEWLEDFKLVRSFANNQQCKFITFETNNRRVAELGRLVGFKDGKTAYILDLGGIS
jgi:hypothetical protein